MDAWIDEEEGERAEEGEGLKGGVLFWKGKKSAERERGREREREEKKGDEQT